METLIKRVNDMKAALQDIQDIFKGNPGLDKLEIKSYSEEDGGDINLQIYELIINLAAYQIDDDSEYCYVQEVEDGILSKEELIKLEEALETLLETGSEIDCNTVIIKREEILKLII